MLQLDLLQKHMDKCDTLAEWIYQEFIYEFDGQCLASWQAAFAAGQCNGDWKTLIAVENGCLLGGASLARNDLAERPDLSPWLACVFVTPSARRRGIAAQLIEGISRHAQAAGVATLYLHTQNERNYYAKLGWQMLERFEGWGREHSLMFRPLQ
ncbi:GNAT family N-acetyltransferase [Pseudomonas sp. RIT-PI-S]|uniref:GNAT family N-acetyltransferase n=1 Tax=Pseudomonas sp. RIT-PI-S TaxID=3035295 RepID=UPI0021D802F8|nr:GNAT family N-acetyltransferase [Pseudomonas sp. RIT-PI-S]